MSANLTKHQSNIVKSLLDDEGYIYYSAVEELFFLTDGLYFKAILPRTVDILVEKKIIHPIGFTHGHDHKVSGLYQLCETVI